MIYNKQDIINTLLSHSERLRSYNINRIGLFGSFKNENTNDRSDVDLLVEFEPGKKSFKNYTGAYLFLKDVLKKEIDFITPESLSPYIGPKILENIEYVAFNR